MADVLANSPQNGQVQLTTSQLTQQPKLLEMEDGGLSEEHKFFSMPAPEEPNDRNSEPQLRVRIRPGTWIVVERAGVPTADHCFDERNSSIVVPAAVQHIIEGALKASASVTPAGNIVNDETRQVIVDVAAEAAAAAVTAMRESIAARPVEQQLDQMSTLTMISVLWDRLSARIISLMDIVLHMYFVSLIIYDLIVFGCFFMRAGWLSFLYWSPVHLSIYAAVLYLVRQEIGANCRHIPSIYHPQNTLVQRLKNVQNISIDDNASDLVDKVMARRSVALMVFLAPLVLIPNMYACYLTRQMQIKAEYVKLVENFKKEAQEGGDAKSIFEPLLAEKSVQDLKESDAEAVNDSTAVRESNREGERQLDQNVVPVGVTDIQQNLIESQAGPVEPQDRATVSQPEPTALQSESAKVQTNSTKLNSPLEESRLSEKELQPALGSSPITGQIALASTIEPIAEVFEPAVEASEPIMSKSLPVVEKSQSNTEGSRPFGEEPGLTAALVEPQADPVEPQADSIVSQPELMESQLESAKAQTSSTEPQSTLEEEPQFCGREPQPGLGSSSLVVEEIAPAPKPEPTVIASEPTMGPLPAVEKPQPITETWQLLGEEPDLLAEPSQSQAVETHSETGEPSTELETLQPGITEPHTGLQESHVGRGGLDPDLDKALSDAEKSQPSLGNTVFATEESQLHLISLGSAIKPSSSSSSGELKSEAEAQSGVAKPQSCMEKSYPGRDELHFDPNDSLSDTEHQQKGLIKKVDAGVSLPGSDLIELKLEAKPHAELTETQSDLEEVHFGWDEVNPDLDGMLSDTEILQPIQEGKLPNSERLQPDLLDYEIDSKPSQMDQAELESEATPLVPEARIILSNEEDSDLDAGESWPDLMELDLDSDPN